MRRLIRTTAANREDVAGKHNVSRAPRETMAFQTAEETKIMPHTNIVERRFAAFLRTPLSVRKAMAVIVSATLASVVVGGVLIRLVDSEEFLDVGTGMWWVLQTVTTVGYGNVTPMNGIGRLVGAVVMLEAIAFIAIVTAAITSSFVERVHRERTRPPRWTSRRHSSPSSGPSSTE